MVSRREAGAMLVRQILKDARDRGPIIILACHDKEELEYLSDEVVEISELGNIKR